MWSMLGGDRNVVGTRENANAEPFPEDHDRLELLSAMSIFRDLSEEDVAGLMDSAPMRTSGKGTVFYGAQDGPEVLFLLKSGRVELYRESPAGKKLTLAVIEPGAIFGEMSLVDQRLVGTSAMAVEDSVICAMSRDDVQALMLRHPAVAVRIMEVLAGRLHQTRDALQEMAFNDVTGRVAALLLRLANEDTDAVDGYSHHDLASMVGCLRESFTATVNGFKRSGAVETGRKRIEIVDRGKLEWIVNQRSGIHS